MKSFIRNKKGAVAVEFALVAPLFVMAIVMTAELGLAAYDKMKLTAGVRSASQYVLQGGTDQTVVSTIIEDSAGFKPTTNVSYYCTCSNAPTTAVACTTTCNTSEFLRRHTSITAVYSRTVILKNFKLESKVDFRSS